MRIESTHTRIDQPASRIYNYLRDLNNLIHLLPQDRITNWESTEDSCSFKIQNAATIDLQRNGGTEPELIEMKNGMKSPFPFELFVHIKVIDENTCEGHLLFDGKVNPFLKMMVEKPLVNLFEYMSSQLKEVSKTM